MTEKKKYKLQRPIQKIVRLSEQENELINKKVAASVQNNFQNFARLMLINGEVKFVDYSELRTLNSQVNRIGNNVNQVAKLAHLFNEISPAEIEELKGMLQEMKQLITGTLNQEIRNEKSIDLNNEQPDVNKIVEGLNKINDIGEEQINGLHETQNN
ncbi:hypothetical protein WOSG25_090430 [Weissella oryzae SG25]|uniref:Uncharacterized protein n=1 Tax=Weissella oryzae (strain DSM 25784 / JCM 18191 / LMG 30913 / SG25) TaxID=1329250 RepID=A0A069D1W8_WEIOS|nr:plasmid mobilization relaxosome protein MobC [Weissella oryzae]GAK31346.1 hypothetical protein WOSG25_090430 [Weissella oryzae SG25]